MLQNFARGYCQIKGNDIGLIGDSSQFPAGGYFGFNGYVCGIFPVFIVNDQTISPEFHPAFRNVYTIDVNFFRISSRIMCIYPYRAVTKPFGNYAENRTAAAVRCKQKAASKKDRPCLLHCVSSRFHPAIVCTSPPCICNEYNPGLSIWISVRYPANTAVRLKR